MCITYFSHHHTGCDHKFLTGSFNCGLSCPPAHRHLFLLDDLDTYGCSICRLRSTEELDPDIVPVKWQPCTQDKNGDRVEEWVEQQAKEQEQEQEQEVQAAQKAPRDTLVAEIQDMRVGPGVRRSAASLSDVDSETSEWRQDTPPPAQSFHTSPPAYSTPKTYPNMTPQSFPMPYPTTPHSYYNTPTYRDITPRTAMHQNLVRGQLAHLPVQPHVQPPPQPRPHVFGASHGPSRPIKPLRARRTGSRGSKHARGKSGKGVVVPAQKPPNVGEMAEFPDLPGVGDG